jgi:hypothetical protein
MPLQATSGAASYDAFGGGVPAVPNYIEEVFSTWLWTGTGATQTITNNIDLSTKGGMVWIKSRSNATSNVVFDTVRGATKFLATDTTNNEDTISDTLTAFNTTGFTLGSDALDGKVNTSPRTYVGWTFREQPKFFDVVTYTGDGAFTQLINHSLGSVPGAMFIKRTNSTSDWFVYHRNVGNDKRLLLNTTAASATSPFLQYETPTSTQFTVGWESGVANVNESGATYVAYLFAHNAGGFGLTGTDNVITCGTFTAVGNNATVELGWEPQWILYKRTNAEGVWYLTDTTRGWSHNGGVALYPNLSDAESSSYSGAGFIPTATGFKGTGQFSNAPFIYIAIRKGPMKVPTSGTSVFSPIVSPSSDALGTQKTTNFPVDMQLYATTDGGSNFAVDRLRAVSTTASNVGGVYLYTNATDAEGDGGSRFWNSTGFQISNTYQGLRTIYWNFRRAPSFFDEVCYTGNGASNPLTHNLGVTPELAICKRRNSTGGWEAAVPSATAGYFQIGESSAPISLNTTNGNGTEPTYVWSPYTTATSFNPYFIWWNGNVSGGTYVAYLFATCAGVSKVGIYTGTATTKQIDCGFTGGARFVMIKRTDSTGDWYVWDSARGIVSGNDPYLLLNSTAAEVTNTDYVDTYSAGFEISSTAPSAINASGGTFIFLAIA